MEKFYRTTLKAPSAQEAYPVSVPSVCYKRTEHRDRAGYVTLRYWEMINGEFFPHPIHSTIGDSIDTHVATGYLDVFNSGLSLPTHEHDGSFTHASVTGLDLRDRYFYGMPITECMLAMGDAAIKPDGQDAQIEVPVFSIATCGKYVFSDTKRELYVVATRRVCVHSGSLYALNVSPCTTYASTSKVRALREHRTALLRIRADYRYGEERVIGARRLSSALLTTITESMMHSTEEAQLLARLQWLRAIDRNELTDNEYAESMRLQRTLHAKGLLT